MSLVRPRTTMQDSNQSLGLTTTGISKQQQQQQHAKQKRSIVVLSLFGACMFLLILCACLVTALVLVGRSLSENAALLTAGDQSYRVKASEQRIPTAAPTDNIYLLSIKDFASKIIPSTTVEQTTESLLLGVDAITKISNSSESIEENSSERTFLMANSTVRNMRTTQISKIIDQLGWRLPNEIRPTLYNLLLRPNFQTQTFSGNVSINLNVSKPISFVAVHSKYLSVSTISLKQNGLNGSSSDVEVANVFDYSEREYWVTEVAKPLDVGEYVLNLSFNGKLTDRIVGFYQSSYTDVNTNQTR